MVFSVSTDSFNILLCAVKLADMGGIKTAYGGVFNTFWDGVAFVVGLNNMAAFLQPNSSRYAKSTKEFVKASALSVLYGMVLMHFLAATLAVYALPPDAPFADPFLIGLGTMGAVGGLMVWILIWTTADNDYWHISLSLFQLFPKIKRLIHDTILVIINVLIIYAGILYRYVDFAITLAIVWPAIPGIMIAHYFIIPKLGIDKDVLVKRGMTFNWVAFVAWIIETLAAYHIRAQGLPFAELVGLIVALIVYTLGMTLYRK